MRSKITGSIAYEINRTNRGGEEAENKMRVPAPKLSRMPGLDRLKYIFFGKDL